MSQDEIKSKTADSDKKETVVKDLGPLVIIETTAPIPAQLLRRKFTENVEFHIDYSAGKYRGKPLINYLANLNIKVRFKLTDRNDALALVKDYLNHPGMAKIDDLIDIVMQLMLGLVGRPNKLTFDPTQFAAENQAILMTWFRRIASLPAFAMWVNPKVSKEAMQCIPVDEDASLPGINFVHLISHEMFPLLVEAIPQSAWNVNETFFKERLFSGNNLFYYFAIPENPLHIATISQDPSTADVPALEE